MKHKYHISKLIIFLMSIVLIVLIVFIFLKHHMESRLKEVMIEKYHTKFDNYFDKIELEISNLYHIQAVLEDNYYVKKMAYDSENMNYIEKNTAYLQIIETMKLLEYSNNYIRNINIYLVNDKMLISSLGYTKYLEYTYDIFGENLNELFYYDDRKLSFKLSFDTKEIKDANILIDIKLNYNTFVRDINMLKNSPNEKIILKISGKNIDNNNTNAKTSKILTYNNQKFNITIDASSESEEINLFLTMANIVSIILFITGISSIIISIIIYYIKIYNPLKQLSIGLKEIRNENYKYRIKGQYANEIMPIIISFNETLKQLEYYFNITYKQKLLLKEIEIKRLQSQINPHFLHNTYFFLRSQIMSGDYEGAEEFTYELSQFFKYITYIRDKVDLYLEYEHAVNYLRIQNKRLNNKVKLIIDKIPKDFLKVQVPYLIIQPIIENSFKYVFEKKNDDCYLKINIDKVDNYLSISIKDSGKISDSKFSEVLCLLNNNDKKQIISGLRNIKDRLNNIGGNLFIAKGKNGGLVVYLQIKLGGNVNV